MTAGRALCKAPDAVRGATEACVGEYQAQGLRYRVATLDDDAALRRLLRENDMHAWVRLGLEREPCYFSGASLMGPATTVIAHHMRSPKSAAGMYVHASLPVHLNGVGDEVGYLSGLRVDPAFRHRIGALKHGFAAIPVLVGSHAAQGACFTSITCDNRPARRLLEANLPGMPVYQSVGELETLAISTVHGRRSHQLRQATARDIPALAEFHNRQAAAYQFSPWLTPRWLEGLSGAQGLRLSDFWIRESGGAIHGCLAIWDQRPFKQTVIRGYRFPLNRTRHLYNLHARLSGRLCLPALGSRLEAAFIAFMAFDAVGEPFAVQALRHALAILRARGVAAGVVGISPQNSLRECLYRKFRPTAYRTCIDTVSLPGQDPPIPDRRPPQPEAAVL